MIKKLLAISLAAFSLSASAQAVQTWNFVWSGPFAFGMDGHIYEDTYVGSFSAIDRDSDGLIVASEVTSLVIDGDWLVGCGNRDCTLDAFSYKGGNDLTFKGRYTVRYDEPWGPPSSTHTFWDVRPGGGWETRYCNQMCNDWEWAYEADGTTFTVTAAVPEPQGYLMLGIGLMAVGCLARKKAHERQQLA